MRHFITKIKAKWYGGLEKIPGVKSLNWKDEIPDLKTGSLVFCELQDEMVDIIAGLCRMGYHSVKPKAFTIWKVKEKYEKDGKPTDYLCVDGRERILLKYVQWEEGNLAKIPGSFCHNEVNIKFYYLDK